HALSGPEPKDDHNLTQSLAVAPVAVFVARSLYTDAMADPVKANAVTFWSSMQLPLTTCLTMIGLLSDLMLDNRPAPVLWTVIAGATILLFTLWLGKTARATRGRNGA
ncbi:hypothetical protein ACFWZ5_45580, partial [Streptomyces sp. NPDC059003]